MCSHLQHVQSFATCPVICNMSNHLQHVQSFTTCPVIYNMSSHLQCAVIYNMAGYTLIRRLQFSRRSLLHDGTFAATCPGSYDNMFLHICTTCPIPYNMCTCTTCPVPYNMYSNFQLFPLYMNNMSRPLQHVQAVTTTSSVIYVQHVLSLTTYAVIYNMCSHLQHVQSFTTCAVICNMSSHLQHVQSFTTCAVIYNMCSHLQHVHSFATCPIICNMSSHLQHVQSFTT